MAISTQPMNTGELQRTLGQRFEEVEERIRQACARAGRSRDEVTLVAVTKTASVGVAALLPALGYLQLGESRPQELGRKAAALPRTVQWHLIGHLQRNKIAATLPLVRLIHSVDSVRLMHALEQEAARQQRSLQALIQVNASREPQKHGFAPEELRALIPILGDVKQIQIVGLMTMAAHHEDPEQSRETFALLRQLRDRLRTDWPPAHSLEHLSMGMSNDFEVAVAEGATLVRIGSLLFESLPRGF